jgi:SAM-dependent methyltransferase/uncharacterized protein YbaR (Trm112 family)
MKTSLVPVLACPVCQGSLALLAYKSVGAHEVIDGLLRCACGAAYLVRDGVPCLAPTAHLPPAYAQAHRARLAADAPQLLVLPASPAAAEFSFSWQWNEHAYNDLTWELRLRQRIEIFYRYVGLTAASAAGLRVLDAGCGNGTLSAEFALEGMRVVALDFSDGAFRAYQYQMFQSRVTEDAASRLDYVQGDLQQPPFRDGEFDLIYSDGVLHHTPDTKRTFMALATKVRAGGRLFVWLYRSDTHGLQTGKRLLVKLVRRTTGWMPYRSRLALCYVGAALILLAVRLLRLLGWRGRPSISLRQKAINLFDTIAPSYNHEHTPAETASWYREAGYTDVREVTIHDFRLGKGGFAIIGTRRVASR